ncbi:MAG: S8 family serine peptidase [Symploca sp. SIO3C6]|uniref:S8 family serine peptidase n=1 Tax=Symploca sp. SIO1C4 TaxID=2607765 RepID=A0A6B3N6W0_9CYAN|nr:S8 family serine peptidase [Symploca sp. SIO3C6]NER27313.1 S8 family serine peptidase [Symploca sp. SIO1C4]
MKLIYKTITSVAIATSTAIFGLAMKVEAMTFTSGGLTTTQGDVAMKANIARSRFNVNGSGVKVGIISDSFNNLNGAVSDVASGDLPTNFSVIQDMPSGGSDEGRALAQIIHDVAPGAELIFHTSGFSPVEFSNAIFTLADAGVDLIVFDVASPFDPMFQDGIVAQAIDTVASRPGASAVSFFAAGGNQGSLSYESPFNPSGVFEPIFGGELHDFDPGPEVDTFQQIKLPQGEAATISFQWLAPYLLADGSGGAPNDLDIWLYDSSATNVLASSTEDNIGLNPVELLDFLNEEGSTSELFNLAISNNSGPIPGLIKYVVDAGRDFQINEFNTASGTIVGNPNANGALTVGAARYTQTPAFGVDPAQPEFFSSAGGSPILLDPDGNPLATPEIRRKPEVIAPDGVNTTFFGLDIPEDTDNFPNFFGTSASVAHVAAVAALMLEANPNLDPETIYSILQETALDMDDPDTPGFDRGFDFATGYGLIDAVGALNAARTLNTPTESVPEPSSALGLLVFSALGAVFIIKNNPKK